MRSLKKNRLTAHPRSRFVEEQFVHQTREPAPSARLFLERPDAGSGDRVVLGVAVVLRLLPRPFDPPLLFEPDQRRIQRALVQLERVIGDLIEARRQPIGMLRAHGRQRSKDDEIERALEELDAPRLIGWATG